MPKVSKAQGRFMGLVRSGQKGKTPAKSVSPKVRDAAKTMTARQVRDYAHGPQWGVPERAKKGQR